VAWFCFADEGKNFAWLYLLAETEADHSAWLMFEYPALLALKSIFSVCADAPVRDFMKWEGFIRIG